MAISNVGSYGNAYESVYASKQTKTSETEQTTETGKTGTETNSATRSTAADELAYLSKKYSGYNFVAGVYQVGTKFGSSNTTNIMIDPRFLEKMANDSDLEAEFEQELPLLADLDNQIKSYYESRGWSCECGTIIDKDGNRSGWTIVTKDPNAKSYLQKMSENAEKIRKQNDEKKKEKAELAEKRELSKEEKDELKEKLDKLGKEKLGDKFKGVLVLSADDKEADAGRKEKAAANGDLSGTNVDMKA